MASLTDTLEEIIAKREFPSNSDDFISQILDDATSTAFPQENTVLDYKEEWPFSFSDDYFGGIVRLICAFHNTRGGIILFGVHDKKRTICHNKVRPDIEKLNNYLRLSLNNAVECHLRILKTDTQQRTTIGLIVPRRTKVSIPVWATRKIGKYAEKKIWIRQAHEVTEASSKDLPILLNALPLNSIEEAQDSVLFQLPPSPAAIKTFVGRIPVMIELVRWIIDDDEPRKFLYGKGGSGKTTIAYEFAKFLSKHGSQIQSVQGKPIQQVVFLTAKEQKLDTKSGRIVEDHSSDFSDESELYQAILQLSGWTSVEDSDPLSLNELRSAVKEMLESITTILVIDDIDTLTTKGKEAGFEFLFKVLSRSNVGSRILYTLRNAPSQSIENSIEVPGLDWEHDYPEFVRTCCQQFHTELPSDALLRGKLAVSSERRPLILEGIVGIRRTCDSYERALDLFQKSGGADIRRYVFEREWTALPSNNSARHLLLALAMVEKALSFDDLLGILQYSDETLRDAISDTSEMFLSLTASINTQYTLDPLTRQFVLIAGLGLNQYSAVKTRVEFFRKAYYPINPMVSRLELKCENHLRYNAPEQAWRLVADLRLSDQVKQDPRFRALHCKVASKLTPPKLSDARESYDYCISMKYAPPVEVLRAYAHAEMNSGIGFARALQVCNLVIEGGIYSIDNRGEFLSKKGYILYETGCELLNTNSIDAFPKLRSSIICNCRALYIAINGESRFSQVIEKNVRSSSYKLAISALQSQAYDELAILLHEINAETEVYADPLLDPLVEYCQRLVGKIRTGTLKINTGKLRNTIVGLSRNKKVFREPQSTVALEMVIENYLKS